MVLRSSPSLALSSFPFERPCTGASAPGEARCYELGESQTLIESSKQSCTDLGVRGKE